MKLKIKNKYNPENDITIVNGNCIELLEKIEDNSLQLIVTSPPYNIGKEYEKKIPMDEYLNSQEEVINLCANKLSSRGSLCWQVGHNISGNKKEAEVFPLDIILYDLFKRNELFLRNRIVWHFGHGLHNEYRFAGRHETILWFTKTDDYTFNLDAVREKQKYPGKKHYKGPNKGQYSGNEKGKNPSDVWDIPNVKNNHIEKTLHPCQFPIALVERLIKALTNPGDMVFDPYMGVGTTVAASIRLKRKAVGSEIDKKYYKIACERVQEAIEGKLLVRPDKPPYKPPINTKLTTDPWVTK